MLHTYSRLVLYIFIIFENDGKLLRSNQQQCVFLFVITAVCPNNRCCCMLCHFYIIVESFYARYRTTSFKQISETGCTNEQLLECFG